MHSPYRQSPPPLGTLTHLSYRQLYPAVADSVPAAREHFAKAASRSGLDADITETALLCLSELATNAVTHAERRFVVAVSIRGMRQRAVRLEVHDTRRDKLPTLPSKEAALDVLGPMGLDSVGGRGLAMVAMMADRTGIEADPNGKTVWCELRLPRPDPSCVSPARETVTR